MARRDGPTMLVLTPAEAAGARPRRAGEGGRREPRRVRAARPAGRRTPGDPHRHRLRGPRGPGRGPAAPGGPGAGAGGLDALLGAVRGPARGYRHEVLPPAVRARLAIEAASPFGWLRWTTDEGAVLGMDGFGASAPGERLFQEFKFTPERAAGDGARTAARRGASAMNEASRTRWCAWASWGRAPGTTTSPATWSPRASSRG